MSEGIRHREIRKQMYNDIKGKAEIFMSHDTGKGHIAFYKSAAKRGQGLSFPDMLVLDGPRVLIVEIETSTKPKLLLGDASTNFYADFAEQKKVFIDISRKSMLFVLPSETIGKKGSGKPTQMNELKRFIEKHLDYEFFDIVTDIEAHDVIFKWLKAGK